ncbi:unnamed protein product [Discula destructiva]
MPSAAEPRPEYSEKMPLTASALDQLDEQMADADSRIRQDEHAAALTPDLQQQGGLLFDRVTSSEVPESGDMRANVESFVASKASHSHSHPHSQANNNFSTSSPPSAAFPPPDAALSQILDDASLPMTDYIVDGLTYRSPDTLGTLIEVGPSPGKGLAVFALRDLTPGTLLLSERPLVALNDNGARADPLDGLVNALPPVLKRAYRSLHGYQEVPSPSSPPPTSAAAAAAAAVTGTSPQRKRRAPPPRESLNRRVLYSNGFAIETTTTAVFGLASRINHSCIPNARFKWNAETRRMDFVVLVKLLEGEEVTIDYGHRKGHLKKYYGFECDCGGCTEWGSVSTSEEGSDGVIGDEVEGQDTEVRLVQKDGFWRPVEVAAIAEVDASGMNGEDGGKGDKENAKPDIQGS